MDVQLGVQVAQWRAHSSPSSCLYQLRQTVQALQEMRTLARDYSIRIPLDKYMQVTTGAAQGLACTVMYLCPHHMWSIITESSH